MRIGIGYDIHKLETGVKMFLGGCEIPYEKGFLGHSDGDILLHAISDAILGAMGKEDIGKFFPCSDPKNKGLESRKIIELVKNIMDDEGYTVENIDCVIVTEAPKIADHRERIIKSVSGFLNIPEEKVNVKGKTSEALGAIGEREAASAYAVVLLNKEKSK